MACPTRFTNPIAVDIWDSRFRWRTGEELHDRTIDATWARVAATAAAAEGPQRSTWSRRFIDAFSEWRLLPDERLLRMAGTGSAFGRFDDPSATLNAGAFVLHARGAQSRFDHERFASIAALAVRLLDDASIALNGNQDSVPSLRIGLLGMADALQALGMRYAGEPARREAESIARSLASGCLQGSVELACERGRSTAGMPTDWNEVCRRRGFAPSLIADAATHGLRHAQLTAIESQPALSLLANCASDALDPSCTEARQHTDTTFASLEAQIELRAAVQPMIDVPIDYPLAIDSNAIDDSPVQTCLEQARMRGLGKLSIRRVPMRPRRIGTDQDDPSKRARYE